MNTELLTKIATADSAEALKALYNANKAEIDSDPVLSATMTGRTLALASYKGVNTESLLKRAEDNETEVKARAESEISKFEALRKIQKLAEDVSAIAREINVKGSVLIVYDGTDNVDNFENFISETVKTAAKHAGREVKAIRKRKSVNVRMMRQNDKKAE